MIIINTHLNRYLLIVLLLAIIITAPFFDVIEIGDGLGWDGSAYGNITRKIFKNEFIGIIDSYSMQRTSLSFMIAFSSNILNIPLTNANIIIFFKIINILFLLLSVFYFFKICKFLNFDKKTENFAFISLYFSYFILKMLGFYPVLLDYTAFSLSIMLFYAFLSNSYFIAFLGIAIGAFTFPSIALFFTLIFLSKNITIITQDKSIWDISSKTANLLKNSISLLAILGYLFLIIAIFKFTNTKIILITGENVDSLKVGLSAITTCLAIFLATKYLISTEVVNQLKFKSIKFNFKVIVGIITVFIFIKICIYALSNNMIPPRMAWKNFLVNLLTQSLQNPLISIVAHILYFGPVLLLFLIFFKSIAKEIQKEGILFAGVFLLNIFFMILGNESRQFVNFMPMLIFYTCVTLNGRITTPFLIFHGISSLIISKFWYEITTPEFMKSIAAYGDVFTNNNITSEGSQRYFMYQGPWMSTNNYLIFLVLIVILFVGYWQFFKINNNNGK